uniref:Uncharacterized protein n=1 Tax=Triticum urartu TaxID=4572 RepID=A0A8R7PSB8_TRIUA
MPPTALHPHHNSDLLHKFPPPSRPPPPQALSPEQGLLLHEHPYPSTKLGCLLVPSPEQRTFLYGPSPKKLHLLYILPQLRMTYKFMAKAATSVRNHKQAEGIHTELKMLLAEIGFLLATHLV